jgi:hypothetical protein
VKLIEFALLGQGAAFAFGLHLSWMLIVAGNPFVQYGVEPCVRIWTPFDALPFK